MTRQLYETIEAYMRAQMADSAHDCQHVYRVLYNALEIAKTQPDTDLDILITACLLHDIGRPAQIADGTLCHAAVGSEKAYHFLLELGLEEAFAAAVRHCIQTHRFRKNQLPQTLEAKILFDADKLDVTGTIGIARTLLYMGTLSEPLYTLRSDGSISDGRDENEPSFFREYTFKLEKLYDRFFTPRGAELARRRQADAAAFYESLYREVSEGYTEGKTTLDTLLL